MTELMRLYLQIRSQNPGLSDTIVRQQALVYFFRKNSPIPLSSNDLSYLQNQASSYGIDGELTYTAPIPPPPAPPEPEPDLSINDYVEDDYIDDYFE